MDLLILNAGIGSSYEALFELAFIIVVGLVVGRIFEFVKLPDVTGYLFAGLLIGPILGIIKNIESLEIISSVALGFIAYEIGTELWLGKLKKSGKQVVIITFAQAILTFASVTLALQFFLDLEIAIVLGAIATATAPAPIMVLTKKYRSKGPLTDTLLPVVGIDDALGILIFGIAIAIAKPIAYGTTLDLVSGVAIPLTEIGISCLLGAVIGVVVGLAIRTIDENSQKESKFLDVTVIAVLLSVSSAMLLSSKYHLHISPILVPMVTGFVYTNMIDKDRFRTQERVISNFTPPMLIAFFTIAGVELDLNVFSNPVMLVGIAIYVIARAIGKVLGTYFGACACESCDSIKKYCGIALLPQAGVSIGLSIAASSVFPGEIGAKIQAIVLAGIIIFELIGPILVSYSLRKANEIRNPEYL